MTSSGQSDSSDVPPRSREAGEIARCVRFVRRFFLLFLGLAYLGALFVPGPGVWLHVSSVDVGGVALSPVVVLLSLLMFNAGLAIDGAEILSAISRPSGLFLGILNRGLAATLGFFSGWAVIAAFSPSSDELLIEAGLLLGLLMVAVMPSANSSVGWTQNADGKVSKCLFVVVITTLASPLVSPILLTSGGKLLPVSEQGTIELIVTSLGIGSLGAWLAGPLLLGVLTSAVFRRAGLGRIVSGPKASNWICLLLLNYTNASVSLPRLREGAPSDLVVVAVVAGTVACVGGFLAASILAVICYRDPARRAALIFPAAMSNGGYALTVASATVPTLLLVQLVVIVQTLVQHVVAGIVDRWLMPNRSSDTHLADLTRPLSSQGRPDASEVTYRPSYS